jgi:hypothetical protein
MFKLTLFHNLISILTPGFGSVFRMQIRNLLLRTAPIELGPIKTPQAHPAPEGIRGTNQRMRIRILMTCLQIRQDGWPSP